MFKVLMQAAVVVVLSAGMGSAATVLNGDFEQDPGVGGLKRGQSFANLNSGPGRSWETWETLPGWTTTGGFGIEVQSNRTLRSIDAYSGSHYVELDSDRNSSMSQTIMLNRGSYLLQFAYSPRTRRANSNDIGFGVGNLLSDSISGTELGHRVGSWSIISRVLSVTTTGQYDLWFAAEGRSDSYGGLIDAVSVERIHETPTGVPLPAPAAMLGATLAGLACLRRFRRATA